MTESTLHAPPTVLRDRYEVIRRLGVGGMSTVYLGTDRTLKRSVAIKVLLPALAEDKAARLRFQREAEAVARLKHQGILEIHDYAVPEESEPFMVMEYVDGLTLRRFVEHCGAMVPEAAARLVSTMSRALQAAHDDGVIHRDLKPENVMVGRDGRVLLMDFGIAHVMGLTKLTLTGALVGSPAHMAPEVIDGAEAGPAADVFALGTVLYFVLTGGVLPFEGRTPHEVMKRIVDGRYADVRTVAPLVGGEVAGIVERCLATSPHSRFATAGRLADALDKVAPPEIVPPTAELVRNLYEDSDRTHADLTERLREDLEGRLEVFRDDNDRAALLDTVNRLLALDSEHAEAMRTLDALSRHAARRRWLRLGTIAVALTAVLLLGRSLLFGPRAVQSGRQAGAAIVLEDPLANSLLLGPSADLARRGREPSERAPRRSYETLLAGAPSLPPPTAALPPGGSGSEPRADTSPPGESPKPRAGRSPPTRRRGSHGRKPKTGSSAPGGEAERTSPGESDQGPSAGESTEGGASAEAPAEKAVKATFPVTILAHPPASHIYVDGRFKGFGRTRDVALAPGGHEIRLEHPGCAACAVTRYTLTVDPARPPGQAFRYRIRYRPARLLVRTDSAGKVFLDDRYIGASNTPLAVEMEGPRPRRAKLRVTAGGAVLGPRNVDLVPGKTTTVQLGVGR